MTHTHTHREREREGEVCEYVMSAKRNVARINAERVSKLSAAKYPSFFIFIAQSTVMNTERVRMMFF